MSPVLPVAAPEDGRTPLNAYNRILRLKTRGRERRATRGKGPAKMVRFLLLVPCSQIYEHHRLQINGRRVVGSRPPAIWKDPSAPKRPFSDRTPVAGRVYFSRGARQIQNVEGRFSGAEKWDVKGLNG